MEHTDFREALNAYAPIDGDAHSPAEFLTHPFDNASGGPAHRFEKSVEEINADLTAGVSQHGWWDLLSPAQKDKALPKLLATQDPDVPREEWLPTVAACARSGAPDARETCRRWSMRSPRYKPSAFDAEFSSYESKSEHRGFSIGTLIRATRNVAPDVMEAIQRELPHEAGFLADADSNSRARRNAALFGHRNDVPAAPRGTKLAELLRKPPHKRRTEHGADLLFGATTLFNARGGLGKTTYLQGMAAALASGVPILGKEVIKQRRVAVINFEEPNEELALKLRATLNHHKQLPNDTADRITVHGAGTLPELTFTHSDSRGTPRLNEAGFDLLKQVLIETDAEILLMDSMSQLFPVGANDTGLVYPAMTHLNTILSELGCAAMVAAHTRKSGQHQEDGAEALLGSVGFVNAARRVIGVRRPSPETCRAIGVPYGREGDIREIVDQKANFSRLEDSHFIEIIGVPMANAAPPDYPHEDWIGVATPFTPQPGGRSLPAAAMQAALAVIASGAAGGSEPYSPAAQAGTRGCLPDLASAIAPHLGVSDPPRLKQAAKEVLKESTTKGWVESYDAKIGRNTRKGLRVVWSATPWATTPAPGGSYVV